LKHVDFLDKNKFVEILDVCWFY